MLSKTIVSSYAVLIEIALWLSLLVGAVIGWNIAEVIGAIIGVVAIFVLSVAFFGGFLILEDIRRILRLIEQKAQDQ